jgi:hypothetical protein
VEPRVKVRKIYNAADRHNQQSGLESLIVLHEPIARAVRGGAHGTHRIDRGEPDYNPGRIFGWASWRRRD